MSDGPNNCPKNCIGFQHVNEKLRLKQLKLGDRFIGLYSIPEDGQMLKTLRDITQDCKIPMTLTTHTKVPRCRVSLFIEQIRVAGGVHKLEKEAKLEAINNSWNYLKWIGLKIIPPALILHEQKQYFYLPTLREQPGLEDLVEELIQKFLVDPELLMVVFKGEDNISFVQERKIICAIAIQHNLQHESIPYTGDFTVRKKNSVLHNIKYELKGLDNTESQADHTSDDPETSNIKHVNKKNVNRKLTLKQLKLGDRFLGFYSNSEDGQILKTLRDITQDCNIPMTITTHGKKRKLDPFRVSLYIKPKGIRQIRVAGGTHKREKEAKKAAINNSWNYLKLIGLKVISPTLILHEQKQYFYLTVLREQPKLEKLVKKHIQTFLVDPEMLMLVFKGDDNISFVQERKIISTIVMKHNLKLESIPYTGDFTVRKKNSALHNIKYGGISYVDDEYEDHDNTESQADYTFDVAGEFSNVATSQPPAQHIKHHGKNKRRKILESPSTSDTWHNDWTQSNQTYNKEDPHRNIGLCQKYEQQYINQECRNNQQQQDYHEQPQDYREQHQDFRDSKQHQDFREQHKDYRERKQQQYYREQHQDYRDHKQHQYCHKEQQNYGEQHQDCREQHQDCRDSKQQQQDYREQYQDYRDRKQHQDYRKEQQDYGDQHQNFREQHQDYGEQHNDYRKEQQDYREQHQNIREQHQDYRDRKQHQGYREQQQDCRQQHHRNAGLCQKYEKKCVNQEHRINQQHQNFREQQQDYREQHRNHSERHQDVQHNRNYPEPS